MRDRLAELPALHDVRGAKLLRELGGERLGVDAVGEFEVEFAAFMNNRCPAVYATRAGMQRVADKRRGAR